MSRHKISKYAQCPFYKSQERWMVICEGTDEENTIHLCFADEGKAYDYRSRFCYDLEGYGSCMIARMLGKKYE